eukprot:6521577-Prorocentrum_lima.AAC.1
MLYMLLHAHLANGRPVIAVHILPVADWSVELIQHRYSLPAYKYPERADSCKDRLSMQNY